jgi:hypothetical protein
MAKVKVGTIDVGFGPVRVIEGSGWEAVESDLGITIQDPARENDVVAFMLPGGPFQLTISLSDTAYVRRVLDMLDAYREWKASEAN